MKKVKILSVLSMIFMLLCIFAIPVLAADGDSEAALAAAEASATGMKAVGAGIAIGVAAGLGALGMGLAIAKSNEGIARQPEAAGTIRGSLILGIVFIETAIIYALVVTILVIFVL